MYGWLVLTREVLEVLFLRRLDELDMLWLLGCRVRDEFCPSGGTFRFETSKLDDRQSMADRGWPKLQGALPTPHPIAAPSHPPEDPSQSSVFAVGVLRKKNALGMDINVYPQPVVSCRQCRKLHSANHWPSGHPALLIDYKYTIHERQQHDSQGHRSE